MALVNQRRKCIYLMEPHTASRAVAKALMAQGGWGQLGHHHIGVAELTDRRRTQLIQNVNEYDIICTIRNPLDVLVTQYKFTPHAKESDAANYMSFFDWVMTGIKAGSEAVTTPMMGLWKDCNKFVYYEHLEDDLEHVFGKKVDLGLDPAHVTTDKKPWETYYEDETGGVLLDNLMPMYGGFMAKFGYILEWNGGVMCSVDEERWKERCQKL